MSTNTSCCPVAGCEFTYNDTDPNALKTHKAKTHVPAVNVQYLNPVESVQLPRIAENFRCNRCIFSTPYPNVMQVNIFPIKPKKKKEKLN